MSQTPTRAEIKAFDELSLKELHDIFWLRNVVFVVGQKITAEPEVDGADPECEHAMLWMEDRLVGTARIFHKRDPIIVGRVAVHTELQGHGLGTVLMEACRSTSARVTPNSTRRRTSRSGIRALAGNVLANPSSKPRFLTS